MTRNPYQDTETFSAAGLNAATNALNQEGIADGCTPTRGTGDFDIDVASGTVVVANSIDTVTGGTVTLSAADSNDRVDLVTIQSGGSLNSVEGTPAARPEAPDIPADEVLVAAVLVEGGASDLDSTGSRVVDYRQLIESEPVLENLTVEGTATTDSVVTEDARADQVRHSGRDGNATGQLTDNGFWTWFPGPRAVQGDNSTFAIWVNKNGDIVVGEIDHDTDSTSTAVVESAVDEDDHVAGALMLDNNGYVWAFWPTPMGSATGVHYSISSSPYDISSMGSVQTISTGTDTLYIAPVQFSDGRVRVYGRRINDSSDFGYVDSVDGGSTWSSPTTITEVNIRPRVYQDGDTVYIAGTPSHPRNGDSHVDYARYEYSTDSYHAADGSTISTPTNNLERVWDASAEGYPAWIWDVTDQSVVFSTYPGEPDGDFNRHVVTHATWDGSQWQFSDLTEASFITRRGGDERQYSPGAVFDHSADGERLFVGVGDRQSSKLQRWETNNGGDTWAYSDITQPAQQNVRPVVPRNPHDDARVLWMRGLYWFYSRCETGIYYSDGEPTNESNTPPVGFDDAGPTTILRETTEDVGSGTPTNLTLDTTWQDAERIADTSSGLIRPRSSRHYLATGAVRMGPFNAAGTVQLRIKVDRGPSWKIDEKEVSTGDTVVLNGTAHTYSGYDTYMALQVEHDTGSVEQVNPDDLDTYLSISPL